MAYAGFWRRLLAYFIDSVLLGTVALIALAPFGGILAILHLGDDEVFENPMVVFATGLVGFGLVLAGVIGQWLYYSLFESSIWQATPGKRALGVFVTDEAGQRISFARATGRYLGKILNHITMNIGYLLIAFTKRKQGLHDIVASTLVIKRP